MMKTKVIICFMLLVIATVSSLTCDEYLNYPPNTKLSREDLELMPPKEIVQCLLLLGKYQLPLPETEYIWQTIIRHFDGISNIPPEVLGILGWVTVAITPDEYENITLIDIDVIQNFGLNYNLNQEQLSALADRVLEDFASKQPEDYTYYDLAAIRQILCAFNKTVIERIHPSSYREASIVIGKLQNCNAEVMTGFAELAVQEQAFGPPERWTEDIIHVVGRVADYLPREFLP